MRWRTSSRTLPAISYLCGGELQIVEEGLRGGDGESGDFADVFVVDEDGAGLGAEALAVAVGAEGVAAILGEEDADVEFVFLALEGGEEAADAGEGAAAVPEEVLLRGVEVVPGDVGGDGGGAGEANHLAVEGAVLGGGPGGDGALREGAAAVGKDEVGVEVDGVAEALAARAGSVGIVEGEETRLRLAVGAMAGGALECGGEP